MKEINFTKMQGLGNDFVMLDDRERIYNNESEIALKLCHRNFGIGADGVIFIRKSEKAHIRMVIYNADGSHASMCGNGIRCFAKYVWDKNIVKENPLIIETDDGIKRAKLFIENNKVNEVEINMGTWSFDPKNVPLASNEEVLNKKILVEGKEYNISSLHMGVPHTVIYTNLKDINIEEGKHIEYFKLFPKKTNVNFCEKVNSSCINVKTWERGAGATLACGTGSCASVVVGNKLGLIDKKVQVNVPGGIMYITIEEEIVFMKGPAKITFEGIINL